ncbi:hypothetical protein KQ910_08480 [Reyranella sp. MMS21-HV4-11]|uniref:Peptidase S1 domain-containing protein n=1 Tax=Reyranella humidisoli TaxID=2849149 RepID=A0ABS6IJ59_9HYPH|nr:hypothetical protein [Reyranella sp. MMS21-HV4-11]MBU8873797.1 hypothetical protein [Reyranella sp. MMS21-HV4-11]
MKLMQCVVPVLKDDERGVPRAVGSCVLLEIAEQYFLLSAAHVLDETASSTLYLPGRNKLIAITGHKICSVAPNGDRDLDWIDVGYVCLTKQEAEEVSTQFFFLPVAFVDTDDMASPGSHYIFSGYPATAVTRRYQANVFDGQVHTFVGRNSPYQTYWKAGTNFLANVVVGFQAKKAKDQLGKIVRPKDRQGMSGGGIWVSSGSNLMRNIPTLRLCGIGIEHQSKNQCLVGTRLFVLLEMIRRDFPHLSNAIPTSAVLAIIPTWAQEGEIHAANQFSRTRLPHRTRM